VVGLDALAVGKAAAGLGAARQVQGGVIDDSAGVRILAGVGSEVSEGDGVLELLARDPGRLEPAAVLARAAIEIADEPGVPRGLVLGTIDAESLSEPTP
jgi:pyrimidine-nucleoside phosphorylase